MAPFAHEVTASALFAIAFGVTSPLLQHYDVPRRIALSEDAAVSLAIFGWLLLFLSPAFRAATRCATTTRSGAPSAWVYVDVPSQAALTLTLGVKRHVNPPSYETPFSTREQWGPLITTRQISSP